MYDEISFLFETNKYDKINSRNDTVDIFNNTINVRFKGDNKSKGDIINYLSESSYIENTDRNPYLAVIDKLNTTKQLAIGFQDLAYLTDLGVYPVNRLVILRRFAEGVMVPHDLNEIDVAPISTVIGWIKPEDDNIFDISFHENWKTTDDLFWDVINDIVERETGVKLPMSGPVPGWAQGVLFQFLNEAGYTGGKWGVEGTKDKDGNYIEITKTEIPVGDPDVLKESSTREVNSQGIESTFSFKLETSYEQKYINGIDPGSAMLDIINNLLKMGTSDMKFMLGGRVSEIMNVINSRSSDYTKVWFDEIKKLATDFINTLNNMVSDVLSSVGNTTDFIENGLNAALYRFRWPMKGSLGVMSGLPTAPWHLTIGNPLNPMISIGNMIVSDSNISAANEMGFNDMPTKINVKFDLKMGRPLGKNEIIEILNNAYGRSYSSSDGITWADPQSPSTIKTQTGGNTVSNDPQPDVPPYTDVIGYGNNQSSVYRGY